jgi:hypothetical protein
MQPATYPSSFPSTRGLPPIRRPLRRLAIVAGACLAATVALAGGTYVYMRVTPQHEVLVDNGNDFAVDVEVGGERLSLPAHTARAVRAHNGTLAASATGANGLRETASLELPATGWTTSGRTAVYNVGGAARLAIVTVEYGLAGGPTPPLQRLAPEPRLQLLPIGSYGEIDEAFPEQIKTKGGGGYVRRVCHVDDARRHLGCHGANRDD